jgi:hypothetical protein
MLTTYYLSLRTALRLVLGKSHQPERTRSIADPVVLSQAQDNTMKGVEKPYLQRI